MSDVSRTALDKSRQKSGIDSTSTTHGSAANASVKPAFSARAKKNPIESVITTLPIIMLLGGLAFYYFNERRQVDGQILMQYVEEIEGEYAGISQQSDKPDAQRILWIKTPSRLRGGRIDYLQAQKLGALTDGDPLTVRAAPKVQGSKTLWVVEASSRGQPLIRHTEQTEALPAIGNQ